MRPFNLYKCNYEYHIHFLNKDTNTPYNLAVSIKKLFTFCGYYINRSLLVVLRPGLALIVSLVLVRFETLDL